MRSIIVLTCALSWSAIAAEHDVTANDLTDGGRAVLVVESLSDGDPWASYNLDDFLVVDFAPVVYADDVDPVHVPAPEHRGSDDAPRVVLGWSAVALRKLGE